MTDVNHILRAADNNKSIVQIAPELVLRIDEDAIDEQRMWQLCELNSYLCVLDANEQEALLAQAFEDDDVVADFEAEKRAIEQAEQPKDVDLSLPGWGEWTGPGIGVSRKKKERWERLL